MAASINNRVEGESTTSPLTISGYTPTAGSNQKLVVMWATRHSAGSSASATATYAGNSLTEVMYQGNNNETGVQIWELDEPTALAVSGDIVITDAPTILEGIKAQVTTLLGVKAVIPDSANTAKLIITTTSSVSDTLVASGDNSVIMSVCGVNGTGDAWTPAAPLTTSASDTTGGDGSVFWADDILADGSGTTTIQWDDDAGTASGAMVAASFAAQGPGGDVKVAVVSGALSADVAGTADFTKTDFGTPKACIVIVSRDAADDTSVAGESVVSIGFSDFNNDYSIGHQDEDASAKVDCDSIKWGIKCYVILAVDGSIETQGVASTITNGVRITNSDEDPAAAYYATVIMFGGADLAVAIDGTAINSSQDGTATRAHSGFTDGNDKLIFFIGADIGAEGSSSSGINNSFGVCHATGSDAGGWTFVQRCIGWSSDHNATTSTTATIFSTDRVLDILTEAGAQDWGLEVTAFSNASGTITVTTRDAGAGTGMEVYSLALDLDVLQGKIGDTTAPFGGTEWSPPVSLGFTPQYVGLCLTQVADKDTIKTDSNATALGISSNTGTGEETCHSWYIEPQQANTDTANLFRSDTIDFFNSSHGTRRQHHSHSSFDYDGWTYTINTENQSATAHWFYWAVEDIPVSETLALLSSGKMGIQNSFEGPFEI